MSAGLVPSPPLFDLAQFHQKVPVMALRLHAKDTERAVKALRPCLLDIPKVRHVVPIPVEEEEVSPVPGGGGGGEAGRQGGANPPPTTAPPRIGDRRLLLLHQSIEDESLKGGSGEHRAAIEAFLGTPSPHPALPGWPLGLQRHTVHLGYEHLTVDAVLRRLLPPSLLLPSAASSDASGGGGSIATALQSGFEIVGHIAHMNLRDEYVPYKAIIGRVILDKNPMIRTVVNKTGVIETTYRTFPMEVIAGEDSTLVKDLRHGGAVFTFDFRHVYWNTRLQHEHELLVRELLTPPAAANSAPSAPAAVVGGGGRGGGGGGGAAAGAGAAAARGGAPGPACVIADGFAGVGPFAIPAAMPPHHATHVYANDLNPASHAALVAAVKRNRVGHKVTTSCGDGRGFLAGLAAQGVPYHHAIMNLPADALAMCDVFVGLFRRGRGSGGGGSGPPPSDRVLPRVHLYCFARSETEEGAADDAVQRLLGVLRLPGPETWAKKEEEDGSSGRSGGAMDAAYALPAVHGDHLPHLSTPLVRGARRHAGMGDLLVRCIRNVAPAKLMLCLSFTVPRAVAMADPVWEWVPAVQAEEAPLGAAAAVAAAGGGGGVKRGREEEEGGGGKGETRGGEIIVNK